MIKTYMIGFIIINVFNVLAMLPNESGPIAHFLQNQLHTHKCWWQKKSTFNQNAGNLGEGWRCGPPKPTCEDSARP